MGNHQARIPMYVQIEQYIRQKIIDNDYAPGKAIPSERELTERFQVSRMTVRQAIMLLVQEGLLVREKGRGTFVCTNDVAQTVGALTTFIEDLTQQGYVARSNIVSFYEQQPASDVQRSLQLPDGAAVYCIERLCFLEDTLIAIEYAYIPVSLFPMLTACDVQHNFYTFVEQQLHEKISIATQQITAASATADEQRRLATEEGAPVLRMHRITKLLSGKPIELMQRTYRADRYTLTTTIVR